MRNLPKSAEPVVLAENGALWAEEYSNNPTPYNRDRYRHPDIKAAVKAEAYAKCVYCESKVGHNCPGDIEHKAPKSRRPDLIFCWNNMTLACSECNRRKGEYYEPDCMFLDPNVDDVETRLIHCGPCVYGVPGDPRNDITLRLLELNKHAVRKELFGRKIEKLEEIKNLCELIALRDGAQRQLLLEDLNERCSPSAEFSAMTRAFVGALPENWAAAEVA